MSTILTDTRSTATTTHTTHTTATTPARPFLLHPRRPPSRNKILCEFAQNQGVNSYGSWRFTSSPAATTGGDDSKPVSNPHKDSDNSRPGSPISSSSSSGREDRLADSIGIGSPGYDADVLHARASRGSSSIGSSWGVSSIGKSFDWMWNASDDVGGASDADTEPTDDDENVEEKQEEQEQEEQEQKQQPRPARLVTSRTGTSTSNDHIESPATARAFGFHSIGSPLSFPSTQTTKNNILDLSPSYNLRLSPLVTRISTTTMTPSPSSHYPDPNPSIHSPQPQSPVHSRPISPYASYASHNVSHNASRAPSSAGSTTSSRFRRRFSQKRISLVAGRISYTPPPSPPLDTDADDRHADEDDNRSPRLLRLNSTSSFMSLASTVATAPPTPAAAPAPGHARDYLGERSISEFVIQGDVGRGAYGLVKRGREVMVDGSYAVSPFFRFDAVGSGLSPLPPLLYHRVG